MRGDAGNDGELHTRCPSQNRAHVWATGVAEMDGPQPADSGAVSVHPVLQRLVVEIEEDRNEMQDEGRLAIVPAFSDLLDGDDLIELGEPVCVVADGRDIATGATDRADGAEKIAGDLCAKGADIGRGPAFELDGALDVEGAGWGFRRSRATKRSGIRASDRRIAPRSLQLARRGRRSHGC